MLGRTVALIALPYLFILGFSISEPPEEGAKPTSAFAPYWYVDEQTQSFLEVKNLLHSPLTLQLTLFTSPDDPQVLEPITVAPQATIRRDLTPHILVQSPDRLTYKGGAGRWGDGSRRNSLVGGAELAAIEPSDADADSFAAWIVTENRAEGLGLVTSFHAAHAVDRPVRLEGLWWLPYEDSRAYLALQNPSDSPAELQLDVYAGGRSVAARKVAFAPLSSQLIDIVGLFDDPPEARVGGLRVTYGPRSAPLGAITRLVLVDQERGFSSPMNLYDSSREAAPGAPSELQAPVAYFGELGELIAGAKQRLRPHLLLRNSAQNTVTVRGSVSGRSRRGAPDTFELPAMSLRPETAAAVDLEEIRRSAGWSLVDGVAGLQVTHDGQPNDLVAELINISERGNLALYDRMRNQAFDAALEQVAISFNLEEGRHSFLVVKNTSDKPQRPRVLLDHASGGPAYDVPVDEIPPQQVAVIDVRHLRDEAVPDRLGRRLPDDVEFGGARIFGDAGAFVSSDPTFIIGIDDNFVFEIAVSCMVFRFPGLGPSGGGGGSAPSCAPKLLSGSPVMKKDTLVAGGETFEFSFDVGGSLSSGQLHVSSRVNQITAPDTVLVGPATDVTLTAQCDAQCNPGFSCSATNCTSEQTGAGSLQHMTARALIDAFISHLGTIEADASGEAIVNNLGANSGHFKYTWFCD